MSFGFHSTAEEVTEGLDLSGQIWLVTGSNSGLGLETIRVLSLRGARIIATARTEEKALEALRKHDIDGIPLACELSDLDSVRTAVATVKGLGVSLQGIIANAGIMALPSLQQKEGIELQLYTNHIGHFALVTGLCDLLCDDARVVVLSSGAHYYAAQSGLELDNLSGERDYHDWRMYGRSKLANILFAKALNARFAGSKKTANAVHPGVIRTNLARHVEDVEAMFENLKGRVQLKNVGQGAATQCFVATHPSVAEIGGAYFSDCQITTPAPVAENKELAEELWRFTADFILR